MKYRFHLLVAAALLAAGCSHREAPSAMADGPVDPARATAIQRAASLRPGLKMGLVGRFAAAPDRGALLGYGPTPVVRHDGAYTLHRVDLSEAHARDAIGGVLTVPLPDGRQLQYRYERHVEHPNGDWTWIGSVPGHPGVEAILTFGDKAAFGNLGQGDGPPIRLTEQNGSAWLMETDPRLLATVVNQATRPTRPDAFVPSAAALAAAARDAASTSATPTSAALTSTPTASNTVDVVVGYTTGFAASFSGGESAAQTRINNLADITNQAYVTSGIDAQIRVVRMLSVSYTDANSNDTALNELTGYSGGSRTTPNAAFGALRSAREQYGADLVSLVRRFNEPENGGCGVAWVNGGGKQGKFPSGSDYFGYSVVSDGRDAGTDGKTYYCRDESFAHELGHNMGAAHDVATAQGSDGVLQTGEYGVFDYSFGYKSASGNFYTVMAYGDTGQYADRVFSNPRLSICGPSDATTHRPTGTLACGTASADNARTLSQTIPWVAAFRATVMPLQTSRGTGGDGNADGRADVFWHSPTAQKFQAWFMNGATVSYGFANTIASKYRIVAMGDFNGDARMDVLWTDTQRGQLWQWLAQADGTYSVAYLRAYPQGWEPVATGDANGDGRADVFWHDATAGRLQVWYMNATSWQYSAVFPIASHYRIAGVGDFDGDGDADILWRDAANTMVWEWQAQSNGASYATYFLRDFPQGWTVAGVGDFNGDGKADVLWHSPTRQAAQPWYMQGVQWTYGPVSSIPSQYRVGAVGDFDGSGRADILWVDATSAWTWLTGANGAIATTYVGSYPPGWYPWNYSVANYGNGAYGGT